MTRAINTLLRPPIWSQLATTMYISWSNTKNKKKKTIPAIRSVFSRINEEWFSMDARIANINEDEIIVDGNTLIYRTLDCRVQNARKRKGMEFHPCKAVGIIEYTGFAKTIDDRFECEALSCYPEITDETCNCSWKFILKDN